jgi:hypothetical protein
MQPSSCPSSLITQASVLRRKLQRQNSVQPCEIYLEAGVELIDIGQGEIRHIDYVDAAHDFLPMPCNL